MRNSLYWAWAALAVLQFSATYGWLHLELGLGPFAAAGVALFALWPVVGTVLGSIGATAVFGLSNTASFFLFFGWLAVLVVCSILWPDEP